jgi:hypothetical protein
VRIAIDIDSTLHHYWDQFSAVARERFGADLAYERQVTWGITTLRPEQVAVCIERTHQEDLVLAGIPYPGAVEAVCAWHRAGHFIHITSHRRVDAHGATAQWLERIGLAYDELYCSYDKVARCREIGIELLIDDSPVNLMRAQDCGIAAATIRHPWNEEICDSEGIVNAASWPELAVALGPVLAASPASPRAAA